MKITQIIRLFFLLLSKMIWFLLNPVKMKHSS